MNRQPGRKPLEISRARRLPEECEPLTEPCDALATTDVCERRGRPAASDPAALKSVIDGVLACRLCRDAPLGARLAHEPRPIFQISASARIAICSQAPGNRAHIAGKPFFDPSGVRLRSWMGLGEEAFYDATKIAIIPMGFCFPGYDRHGGDLPPRRECVARWHEPLFAALPQLTLLLCIGRHSLNYHLPSTRKLPLTAVVGDWRAIAAATAPRTVVALPHPSWRNNAWLTKNPWFGDELLPDLRQRIAAALSV